MLRQQKRGRLYKQFKEVKLILTYFRNKLEKQLKVLLLNNRNVHSLSECVGNSRI